METITATPTSTPTRATTSRLNGSKGRGPVTVAGKRKASLNAVKVGLFCKTIPEYRYPLYYSQKDVADLAADIAGQMGCRSTFTHSLAESIAIDILRLRHIRAMEHAILDPDVERDVDMERALRQTPGHCVEKSEEDHAALLAAATKARDAITGDKPFNLAPYEQELLTSELWGRINAARRGFDRAQAELVKIDEQIKGAQPDDIDWLKEQRANTEQDIRDYDAQLETCEPKRYGIENEDDVIAIITNAKVIAPEHHTTWYNLINEIVYSQKTQIRTLQDTRLRIESLRRAQLIKSLDGMDKLNQLAEYGARIQRHMERTLAMLRDVESGAVIDV